MRLRNQIRALFLLALATIIPVNTASASDQNNLITIQKKFTSSIQPQFEAYFQELTELEKTMAGQEDGKGLIEVRNEIKRVGAQLESIKTIINYQQISIFSAEPLPATKPEQTQETAADHQPVTHVSSTQGIAGVPKFSKNNIYSFNIPATGKHSNLTFYATGRRSTETEGLVWLIKPDGQKEKVTKWKSKDFKSSSTEIKTYKKLDPITADISDLIEVPGQYKVEFEWTGGIDPLVIFRVELTS